MAEIFNTSDATATAEDIKNGETAYARGKKIMGVQSYRINDNKLRSPTDWSVEGTTLKIPKSWKRRR